MKKYLIQEVKSLADIFGVKMYINVHWYDVDDHEMRHMDGAKWGMYYILLEKNGTQRSIVLKIADEKGEQYWADDNWRPQLLAIMENWGNEKMD